MSYLTQNEIAENRSMLNRVAQAAAQENASPDPDRWTHENRRTWASAPGWDAAWESAWWKVSRTRLDGSELFYRSRRRRNGDHRPDDPRSSAV